MVVDYNEDAIANARARGIAGMAGDYKQVQFDGKFDLILLDNVLEHFLDMPSEVAALRALLNEGGGIFVAVPDAHRLDTSFNFADARKEFMLCHSFLFSRETVTAHMRALGFQARAWDHKPFPHSLLVYFEKGDMVPPDFSRAAYDRQQAAFAQAEQKYWLYRLFLMPWFWRTAVPVLKRSSFITGLYRRLRGVKPAMPA
jgi:SAM-dependent methyltransferase